MSYEEPEEELVERNYAIIVRDIGQVYADLDDFTVEAKTMVSSYSLPANVEAIVELTDEQVATIVQGAGRKVTPTGSPVPTPPHGGVPEIAFGSGGSANPERVHVNRDLGDETDHYFHDVAGANV
jgi:hypothetical protein